MLWRHQKASEDVAKRKVDSQGGLKQNRAKALQVIYSIDHQLEAVGLGLITFAPVDGKRPAPLGPNEVRYKVALHTGNNAPAPDGMLQFRSAVKDIVSGAKRWDAAGFIGQRPHLSVFSDHGSDISGAMAFLLYSVGIRGSWYNDVYHDTDNDVQNAIAAVGLAGAQHELTFLMNFEHGPWRSAAHYQKLHEGFSSWMGSASPEDDLYAELYERISFDLGEEGQAGSEEHFRRTFEYLKTGEEFSAMDERVCLSRRPFGPYFQKRCCTACRRTHRQTSLPQFSPPPHPKTTFHTLLSCSMCAPGLSTASNLGPDEHSIGG